MKHFDNNEESDSNYDNGVKKYNDDVRIKNLV